MTLPVTLTQCMSHLQLAKAYSKVSGSKSVYVYDNGVLLQGSLFNSYGKALNAIGLSSSSKVIQRNVDTGKTYKGQYTFYSFKL